MEVPVLLIEFEGVLADTAALRRDALIEAFAADGIELSRDQVRLSTGRTTEDSVLRIREAVGAPHDATATDICCLRAERAFAVRAGKGLSLQVGVRQALDALAGVARCALVTRASHREVAFVLDLAGLEGLFRPVIALEDARPPKPDVAPYRAAISKVAQLFPGQTLRGIAIEDTVVGVHAAHAAGLTAVLVGSFAAHEAMEADAWVESFAELTPERVRELIGRTAEGKK